MAEQVLEGERPVLLDEFFFDDKDCDSICFTMKDYKRKGGLATLIANIELPGEELKKAQVAKQQDFFNNYLLKSFADPSSPVKRSANLEEDDDVIQNFVPKILSEEESKASEEKKKQNRKKFFKSKIVPISTGSDDEGNSGDQVGNIKLEDYTHYNTNGSQSS